MISHKTIICDIDDTISITTNRDWINATPIQPVIDKINYLHSIGWCIKLVTARGCISCATRQEADNKYRKQIEDWLSKHNVKYNTLSFEKELGAYYIDDKALRPDEFVQLDIKTLKNGLSGASVELRDGRVFKTHTNSMHEAAWYKIAKSFFNVPNVYSLIGNTISIEYINSNNDLPKVDDVLDIIRKFKDIKIPHKVLKNSFSFYIDRLIHHNELSDGLFGEIILCLQNDQYTIEHIYDKNITFSHGDLSIDNMLCVDDKIFLIDPIYEPDKPSYTSWLIDASKYAYSLLMNDMHIEYAYLKNKVLEMTDNKNMRVIQFNLLVASHCVRVYKYAPYEMKDRLYKLYKDLLSLKTIL